MRHDPHPSAGPLTLRMLPAAVLARRTTASSTATLLRGHPRPWPLSTLEIFPWGPPSPPPHVATAHDGCYRGGGG